MASFVGLVLAAAPKMLQAAADPSAASPPLPPQRPAALSPSSAAPESSVPSQPQTLTKPARNGVVAAPPPPKSPDEPITVGVYNEGPGTLLRLPRASHTRMHQCALEWQTMKAAGTAAEKTWFNFALECLAK
jgi:hypothetical protein